MLPVISFSYIKVNEISTVLNGRLQRKEKEKEKEEEILTQFSRQKPHHHVRHKGTTAPRHRRYNITTRLVSRHSK